VSRFSRFSLLSMTSPWIVFALGLPAVDIPDRGNFPDARLPPRLLEALR